MWARLESENPAFFAAYQTKLDVTVSVPQRPAAALVGCGWDALRMHAGCMLRLPPTRHPLFTPAPPSFLPLPALQAGLGALALAA